MSIKHQLLSEKGLWLVLMLFSILEILMFMTTPFIYQYFIDNVIENKAIEFLFLIVLLYFLSYVILVLFGFLKEIVTTKLSQNVIQKTRNNYYIQLKKSKPTYIGQVKLGSEITVLINEISDVITQSVIGYKNVIVNSLRIIIACVILFFLNYKLLLLLLFLLPIYILLTYTFKGKIDKNAKEYNKIREAYTNTIHDGIEGYEDILIFNKHEWDINNVINGSKRFIKNRVQNTILLRAASDISYLFYWGVICIIYYISAVNIIESKFTLGLMLVYVAYLDNIYSPSRIILSSIAILKNAKSLASNVNNKMTTMKEQEDNFPNTIFYNINSIDEICFKGIRFQYIKDGFHLRSITLS